MTELLIRLSTQHARPTRPARQPRWWPRLRRHRASIAVLGLSLTIVGAANAWNLQGWPGRLNDDEGTYVAEAWAMLYTHHLSHYTYWYDHPPLGWALIAAYAWLTDGFQRAHSAVLVGRELMWWANLVSCSLLYLLGRRLGFRRASAAATVLLFGLSPLAIFFHRMVFLDNLATMWVLAALAITASPRRSLAAAFWSAVCFAAAVWSKETVAILFPTVVWLLWQHTDARTRRWNIGVFCTTCCLLVLAYPLFAALRGELFPGRGHVSLLWALRWQFLSRSGTGSVFDPHSITFGRVHSWLDLDRWLLLGGALAAPVGLVLRRLRPLALALLVQLAVLVKGGYLPYMYAIAMLPFCALLIAGIADTCWGAPRARPCRQRPARADGSVLAVAARGCVISVVLASALVVSPQWLRSLQRQSVVHGDAAELAATAWVIHHVSPRDVVVVDDYMWPDLRRAGMNPLWYRKIDADPQVDHTVLSRGYASIGYIVLAPLPPSWLAAMPTLRAALAHSRVIRAFGDGITARVVVTASPRAQVRGSVSR